jgi:hypothetical protein
LREHNPSDLSVELQTLILSSNVRGTGEEVNDISHPFAF